MLVHHAKYHCPQPPHFFESDLDASGELTATVYRNATIRGKVTQVDGSPAAGIRLQGEGRGETSHYFRGHTSTDRDGRYEIDIYPDQETILAVTDPYFAAQSATGINLDEGDDLEVDFELIEGAVIQGHMTVGEDKQPMVGETATLIQNSGNASLVRWNEADASGHYQFRVGPGTYTLRLAETPQIEIEVKQGDTAHVHDAHVARRPRGMLHGAIIDRRGETVADVRILAEPIGRMGHAGFKTRSNENGTFETERWMDKMLVYAVSGSARAAAFATISEDDTKIKMTLEPAGLISGVANSADGLPLAGHQIQLQISRAGEAGEVNDWITTNSKGEYSAVVAAGSSCKLYLRLEQFVVQTVEVTSADEFHVAPFEY